RQRLTLTCLNRRVSIYPILAGGIFEACVSVVSIAGDLDRHLLYSALRVVGVFLDWAYRVAGGWRSLRACDPPKVVVVLRGRSEPVSINERRGIGQRIAGVVIVGE